MSEPTKPTSGRRLKRRLFVWTKDGGICWLCHQAVSLEEMTLDHEIPRSKGGHDGLANLRAAHRYCNQDRGNGEPRPPRPPGQPIGERAIRKAWKNPKPLNHALRGPIMDYITNENAREHLSMTTDERIALQKQDEEHRIKKDTTT